MAYTTDLEARIAKKVTKAITELGLIEDGDRVMVGLSGGKDSWALIQILDVLRQRAPIRLLARRRQHRLGIRGLQAREDRRHVRGARVGVPHRAHHDRRNHGGHARRERHALLALRAAAPRRALSARRRSGRHEDRARPPRRRFHRNAAAEPVLRRHAEGDAGAAGVGQRRSTSSFGRWCTSARPRRASTRRSAGCRSSAAAARPAATSACSASASSG